MDRGKRGAPQRAARTEQQAKKTAERRQQMAGMEEARRAEQAATQEAAQAHGGGIAPGPLAGITAEQLAHMQKQMRDNPLFRLCLHKLQAEALEPMNDAVYSEQNMRIGWAKWQTVQSILRFATNPLDVSGTPSNKVNP